MMDILLMLERVLRFKLVTIHSTPITGFSLLGVLAILAGAFAASKYAQHLIRAWFKRRADLDTGLQFTAMRLARYLIASLGAVLAVQFIGIDLTSLAVLLSFLSVGIGFGMQNIASNFISGLIILFERPVKPGDWVTIGSTNGAVQEVNLRSTVVKTVDNIAIIVPNSQFITQEVVNWSYGDSKIQLHIPVGVAYGSDVELVTRTLLEVAHQHPEVLDKPEPRVWLTEFGDSALNFELLVWLAEPYHRRQRISELNLAVEAAFRRVGIQIPFPQRDVYIKAPGSL